MNHAITMGIFWHLIGRQCRLFLCPVQESKTLVVGNHVVGRGYRLWLILPWAISATLLPDFWAYYRSFNASTLLPVFLFGAMWGIGNINYGLTMRYLGMSMGIGIAIGITLIVGTLMTPIINGQFSVLMHTQAVK
jgi:L-rhamnose-H+ transport protein